MDRDSNANVLKAVQQASRQWQNAFNSGDAGGCAAQYEPNAVMSAQPFGTFTGTAEIQAFWQRLVDDGFTAVEYINPDITVVDDHSAILAARWQMNKAKGVIIRNCGQYKQTVPPSCDEMSLKQWISRATTVLPSVIGREVLVRTFWRLKVLWGKGPLS